MPPKTTSLLLDTHVIIWLATNDKRLSGSTARLIEKAFYEGKLAASVISAWEIGVLCAKERLTLTRAPIVWFEEFVRDFSINLFELTPAIAIESSFLPGRFHADPADRIIIATASAHDACIVTADNNILKYSKTGLVAAMPC